MASHAMLSRIGARLFPLVLAGCQSVLGIEDPILLEDAGAGGGDASTGVPAAFYQRLASARCDALRRCRGDLYEKLEDTRHEPCEVMMEQWLRQLHLSGLPEAVAGGRVDLDLDALEICAKAIDLSGCNIDLFTLPECTQLLSGTKSVGEACFADVECVDEAFCDFGAGCPGECRSRLGEGAPCSLGAVRLPWTTRRCQQGLVCRAGSCFQPRLAGESCTFGADSMCALGLSCLDSVCRAYSEVMTLPVGAECLLVPGQLCAPDAYCELLYNCLAGACTDVASDGTTPCRPAFPSTCPVGSYCQTPPSGPEACAPIPEGSCRSLPGSGSPCRETTGVPRCGSALRCVDGVCSPLANIGAPCAEASQCHSGLCLNGQCTPMTSCVAE